MALQAMCAPPVACQEALQCHDAGPWHSECPSFSAGVDMRKLARKQASHANSTESFSAQDLCLPTCQSWLAWPTGSYSNCHSLASQALI